MNRRWVEVFVISAVALHSFALGFAMLVRPAWTLALLGWDYEGPLFFPAQSGIFLLILGGAYLTAIWRRPFAWFLVASKAAAVAFLVSEWGLGGGPSMVLVAAFFDGLMGTGVAVAVLLASRAERACPDHVK